VKPELLAGQVYLNTEKKSFVYTLAVDVLFFASDKPLVIYQELKYEDRKSEAGPVESHVVLGQKYARTTRNFLDAHRLVGTVGGKGEEGFIKPS
jgi:hypothetical protein